MNSCNFVFKFYLFFVLFNVLVIIYFIFKFDNFIRVLIIYREYVFKRESFLRVVLSEVKMFRL